MKYECTLCRGHVEMGADYAGEELTCPHCQAAAIFNQLDLDLVTGAEPPVLDMVPLARMVGNDQNVTTVTTVLEQLNNYCTPDESVLRVVVQSKLMSVSIKPDAIAATTRRIIILGRGLFSTKMWDALWVDVFDVQIQESMTGAMICVRRTNGSVAMLDKLPKESAREFYRFCQSKEELMRSVRFAQNVKLASAGAARVNVNVQR